MEQLRRLNKAYNLSNITEFGTAIILQLVIESSAREGDHVPMQAIVKSIKDKKFETEEDLEKWISAGILAAYELGRRNISIDKILANYKAEVDKVQKATESSKIH